MEDYKYNIYHFPPTICISNRPMWFYSVVVITDVLVSFGAYLLFVVFWIIHKVNILLINFEIIIIVLEICFAIKDC